MTGTPQNHIPTIAFMGASITSGWGLRPEESYPALIGQRLADAGLPYRILNAAVPGASTREGMDQLYAIIKRGARVLHLIIALGPADVIYRVPPSIIETNLMEIIRTCRFKLPEARVYLCQGRIYQYHVAPHLPQPGSYYEREFTRLFPRLADEEHATLLPFILEGVAGVDSMNQPDRLHPNAQGAARIADNLLTALQPHISKIAE